MTERRPLHVAPPEGSRGSAETRVVAAWGVSIAAHALVVGAGAFLVARSLGGAGHVPLARAAELDPVVEIELPTMTAGETIGPAEKPPIEATPLQRGGGEATPRPDTGRPGRGGTDTAIAPAENLADRAEDVDLTTDVPSRLDRSQTTRIRSGRSRRSEEDWRASREPMELTFLASGHGASTRPERRKPADRDPAAGALGAGTPARAGGALGAAELGPGVGDPRRDVGGDTLGAARVSPGAGVRDGRPGDDHHDATDAPLARPMVELATPSIPSDARGRPEDTVDSEQEAELRRMQSILHASTAGGANGAGPGGQSGAKAPGSGGAAGAGSKSGPLGTGRGGPADDDPADARRLTYLRQVMSKIGPRWRNAFPRWAALEGLQGTAIVTFVIAADGSVSSATVTRASGIVEYDENCRQAVLRSAPFAPLPAELGTSFRWAMPFETRNPAVRPKDP